MAPVAVLTVLVVVAGVLLLLPVSRQQETVDPDGVQVPVTTSMLLDAAAVGRELAPRQWEVSGTGDNTDGDGINTVCQEARFADPDGEGTLVRALASTDPGAEATRRTLLQTVEVSRTTESASDAYATTLGWFAGCRAERVRLAESWRAQGLGTRAAVLRLRTSGADLLVGVVRSDRVTISLVARTPDGPAVDVDAFAALLRQAVTGVCEADAAGFCPEQVRLRRISAPPSGEVRGTLASADLPAVPGVEQPWVGTRPAAARPNPAATSCDEAGFVKAGAPGATARTYLVPESDLPDRFGLTQTVGSFASTAKARAVYDDVLAALADCEDEDLSVEVAVAQVPAQGEPPVAYWRLDQEVSDDQRVESWMGVALRGRHLTQVLFTAAADADLDEAAFGAVMTRARERLTELGEDS